MAAIKRGVVPIKRVIHERLSLKITNVKKRTPVIERIRGVKIAPVNQPKRRIIPLPSRIKAIVAIPVKVEKFPMKAANAFSFAYCIFNSLFHVTSTKLMDIPYPIIIRTMKPKYLEVKRYFKLSIMESFGFSFFSFLGMAAAS